MATPGADRTHLISQDKPAFVISCSSEHTMTQRVAELHDRKQALADVILEGGGSDAESLGHENLELPFAPLDAG